MMLYFWRNRPTWLNYLIAVTLSSLAVAFHFQMRNFALHERPVLFLVIILSAYLGGWGPSLLAALISSAGNLYYFIPPVESFALETPDDLLDFLLFTGVAVIVSILTSSLNSERKRAQEFADLRTQFAARVGHELRTPLVAILGFSKKLLSSGNLDASELKSAQNIMVAGQDLLKLVNNFLEFSKLENIEPHVEMSFFDPEEIVESCLALLESSAQTKPVELILNITPPNPGHKIFGPESHIKQILLNLIGNAIKFTDSGSVRISYSFLKSSSIDFLRFEIKDTGCGIPMENQKQIFEPYRQVDEKMSRTNQGTGLGLAIVKRLIEIHKGRIGVESHVGKGSLFWFEIPVSSLSSAQFKNESSSLEFALKGDWAPHLRWPTRKVALVIDDNEVNRTFLKNDLTSRGIEVFESESGASGIAKALSMSFDIVFLDYQMPELDGFQTARALQQICRDKGKSFFLVAFTAHASDDILKEQDRRRIQGVLLKPWATQELDLLIERLLQFDGQALRSFYIQSGSQIAFAEELVASFLKQTPLRISNLQKAIENQDRASQESAVHSLVGPSYLLGAHGMTSTCWNFNYSEPSLSLQQLKLEFQQTEKCLLSELDQLKRIAASKLEFFAPH
jgi:signal transduction histidine kinase/DNA-binding response OmpR family regulator